ncbi:polyphosphate polymerase domain-containing protein [Bacteroidia bacterium]|nr:polyphosphate polymerase domain-containing protein [Bacteroidia bacterium]
MQKSQLNILQPISLSEMNEVSLMKRVDTKFLVRTAALPAIIDTIKNSYRVLQIDENRLMTYKSAYYDTPQAYFYHMHHNGLSYRIKIRVRNYVESELSFLEIKQKDSQGNTVKNRVKVPDINTSLSGEFADFITNTTGQQFQLEQSIVNSFNRFTLVHIGMKERVTFDLNLAFNDIPFQKGLAIIELKQESLDRTSPLFSTLKKQGIHPYSISKYCMGMARTHQQLKQNRFKPKFLKINKLTLI